MTPEKAKWGMKGLFKADASSVYAELMEINEEKDAISPADVVEYARDESSELHKCFTWDNDAAADKWRLQEARNVIRYIVVEKPREEDEEPRTYRVFQNPDRNGTGYKPMEYIVKNQDEYEKLKARAAEDLRKCKRAYSSIVEYREIWDLID